MIEIQANRPNATLNFDGTINLTFVVQKSLYEPINAIKTENVLLTIKEFYPKKSLSQNNYLWKLIDELAKVLHESSESIYQHYIRDYGVKDYVLVEDKAVEELTKRWNTKGLGWFAEILRKGKINDTTTLVLYYGSSSYNRQELNRVIEAVVRDCEMYKIPTLTEEQYSKLKNSNK